MRFIPHKCLVEYLANTQLFTQAFRHRGQYLIDEYLELIREHLKDVQEMRHYLRQRGVRINMLYNG